LLKIDIQAIMLQAKNLQLKGREGEGSKLNGEDEYDDKEMLSK